MYVLFKLYAVERIYSSLTTLTSQTSPPSPYPLFRN